MGPLGNLPRHATDTFDTRLFWCLGRIGISQKNNPTASGLGFFHNFPTKIVMILCCSVEIMSEGSAQLLSFPQIIYPHTSCVCVRILLVETRVPIYPTCFKGYNIIRWHPSSKFKQIVFSHTPRNCLSLRFDRVK